MLCYLEIHFPWKYHWSSSLSLSAVCTHVQCGLPANNLYNWFLLIFETFGIDRMENTRKSLQVLPKIIRLCNVLSCNLWSQITWLTACVDVKYLDVHWSLGILWPSDITYHKTGFESSDHSHNAYQNMPYTSHRSFPWAVHPVPAEHGRNKWTDPGCSIFQTY